MADLVAELSQRAKALVPEERARLAQELLASLDPHDAGVDGAWDLEIRRRVQEVEDGTVPLVEGSEAFDEARQALRR